MPRSKVDAPYLLGGGTHSRWIRPAGGGIKHALILGLLACTMIPASKLAGESSQPKVAAPGPISIVLPKEADPVQRFAAQELARYFGQATRMKISGAEAGARHRIFIGQPPAALPPASAQKLRGEIDALSEDGFILRKMGPDVVILGKGSRGDLYGCYAFLERLGIRWFFPGKQHEVVPQRTYDWNQPLDISESPAFSHRILYSDGVNFTPAEDWIDFAAKARLNRIAFLFHGPMRNWWLDHPGRLLPECQKRGMMIELGGHMLPAFLPRPLIQDHPDWFRLNEQGKRSNDFNLNPFSSQGLDSWASNAELYFRKMPEASLFHCWPDDIWGGGWSQEPGKEDYTPSDQSLLAANYLVRRLRASLPDANLAYLAYHDTVFPPHVVKPEPGIIYFYAPRERCYGHSLDDPQCSYNQRYRQSLERALPAFGSANAEVFEYYVDAILFENMTNPPLPEVLSADAKYYHQLGIPGLGGLVVNTSEYVTPAVNMYLYPQALWNPQRDLKKSLEEYAISYFGDSELVEYFRQLELGLHDVLKICRYEHPGDAWDSLRAEPEPDEALAYHIEGLEHGLRGPLSRAASTLDTAIQKAKSKEYRVRLERERVSMGFTLLQATLHYHLLKGEWFCRIHKGHHDAESGLGAATESVLARHTYENLKKFVGRSGIRGEPLVPNPAALANRVGELEGEGFHPALTGVDFSYDMTRFLTKGVNAYLVDSPFGSRVVAWADGVGSVPAMPAGVAGLEWKDEFGRPFGANALTPSNSPAVIEGRGLSNLDLFDALVASLAAQ